MNRIALAFVIACLCLNNTVQAATETTTPAKPKTTTTAPKKTTAAKTTTSKPISAPAPAASAAPAPEAAAIPAPAPAVKQAGGQGEMTATVTGTNKEKMVIGKLDPPAAFNLEDIQNFPEDRLQPLLNAPVTFNEGRDFSKLMDFKEDQPYHPWLPDVAKAPFLEMKSPTLEKQAKEWDFAVIDQGGATVAKLSGKGTPPEKLVWAGDDTQRGRVGVDTVYIPQLNTTDKEGYHHTYMGQPIQFASIQYTESGKTTIELSSRRLFLERKSDFTKEGPLFLDKVCDAIRAGSHLPFAIQPYASDDSLARTRQTMLMNYFKSKLFIPENQIVLASPQDPGKRGETIAIVSTTVPGGSDK